MYKPDQLKKSTQPKGWLNLKEAAHYISKPESWMYENIQKYGIPHAKLGVQYRFQTAQLDSWMLSRQVILVASL